MSIPNGPLANEVLTEWDQKVGVDVVEVPGEVFALEIFSQFAALTHVTWKLRISKCEGGTSHHVQVE